MCPILVLPLFHHKAIRYFKGRDPRAMAKTKVRMIVMILYLPDLAK